MAFMKKNIQQQRILILDFGSQYAQLIARRVREIGVYCELKPWNISEAEIRAFNPSGIILSGGPASTTEPGSPRAAAYVFSAGLPVLGICYGMQTMAVQLGGSVSGASAREFGHASMTLSTDCTLTRDIHDGLDPAGKPLLDVWMSHGDSVTTLPCGFVSIASTPTCPVAAMVNEEKRFYAVQFHPEVTHTHQGVRILARFVLDLCRCQALWAPAAIIEDIVHRLRQQIGDDHVILGLSGGVDSSVTALLLQRAIGNRLTCVFIDNGLLRLHEAEQVMAMFGDQFGLNIVHIAAQQRFLNALTGIDEPEEKRKIIGNMFVALFDEQASRQKQVKWLAQGTIYPDIIESAAAGASGAHVIKSHHNVAGLPETMKLALAEPLKELFKDEVRKIGLELGLSHEMLHRHPFPGPGLAVRVLGEVRKEYCDLLRRADVIFIEELHRADLYYKVSQAFTVFLPVRSVGVMGDGRKYEWVVALRAVETTDFMTASWARLPYEFLALVSSRIINEISGISRVVFDISSKPPATIEWE